MRFKLGRSCGIGAMSVLLLTLVGADEQKQVLWSDLNSNTVAAPTSCAIRLRNCPTSIPSMAQTRMRIVALCATASTRPSA